MCVSNARFSECEPAQTVWVCGRGRRAGDFSEATFRAVRTAQERGHGFRNRRGLFFYSDPIQLWPKLGDAGGAAGSAGCGCGAPGCAAAGTG